MPITDTPKRPGVNLDFGLGDYGLGDEAVLGATYLQFVDVDARFEAGTPRDGMQLATVRLNDLRLPGFADAGPLRRVRPGSSATARTSTSRPRPSTSSRSTILLAALDADARLSLRLVLGRPRPRRRRARGLRSAILRLLARLGDLGPGRDHRRVPAVQQQPGQPHGASVRLPDRRDRHRRALFSLRSGGEELLRHAGERSRLRRRGQPLRRLDDQRQRLRQRALRRGLPGDAAEEAFGEDDPYHLFQIYAIVTS